MPKESVKLVGSQGLWRPWCGDSLKRGKKISVLREITPFLRSCYIWEQHTLIVVNSFCNIYRELLIIMDWDDKSDKILW